MKLLLINIIFLVLVRLTPYSDISGIPEGIPNAFKNGDARALAAYFNNYIELVILDNEDVYNKSQAESLIKDFFKKNPTKDFEIIHQGGKKTSQYAIGHLKTKTGGFRVYILMKVENTKYVIHQMRIEKYEE